MRGDYEGKVVLAKQVFKRFLKDVKLHPELVPRLTQVAMDMNKQGNGRSILVIHDNDNKKTEVYIDGETTS